MKFFVWIPRVNSRAFFYFLFLCFYRLRFIHLFMELMELEKMFLFYLFLVEIKPFVCVKSQKWDDYGLLPVLFLNYGYAM